MQSFYCNCFLIQTHLYKEIFPSLPFDGIIRINQYFQYDHQSCNTLPSHQPKYRCNIVCNIQIYEFKKQEIDIFHNEYLPCLRYT